MSGEDHFEIDLELDRTDFHVELDRTDFEEDFESGGPARRIAPTFDAPLRCWVCNEDNPTCAERCLHCEHPLAIPARFAHGAWLGSRYEIERPIGAGAMGWVFEARDHVLEVRVAIKVLRPEVAHRPALAERFRSEVRLARRVRHRNVCGIHDYGEDQGLQYLSMEYVEGHNLKHVLRSRQRPLSWNESYGIAIQAAAGLQAIHDAGVIHRDVKTANITLDVRGVVRLMDFGIARERLSDGQSELTAGWQIVGTPDYMSPEHVRGTALDARSDVYSLGIVIYEVFMGRVPFHGSTPVATLLQQVEQEPELDGPAAALLPPALVPVLRRALAKERAERPASAGALALALERARDASGSEPRMAPAWPSAGAHADDISTLMIPRLARRIGIDPRECFSTLLSALMHGDSLSRLTAARALGELGPAARAAVPALVRALRDDSGPLRVQAAHALRRIGPSYAAGAVLQLLEVMKDDRRFVSQAAANAVACLTVPALPPGMKVEDN